ncbi:MAG: hypothetical protein AAGD38_03890 [Acidobacteriota bacterium]
MKNSLKLAALVTFAIAVLAVSCAPPPPEVQVSQARARYDVQIASFQVLEPPAEEVPVDEGLGEEGTDAGDETADAVDDAGDGVAEEAGDAIEPVVEPGPVTVRFDVLLRFDGPGEPLPGVTVEVLQQDETGAEKASRRHYIETPGLVANDQRQVSFELEGFEVGETDSFGVTLRQAVPAEERGEYQEYAAAMEAGSGG